MGQVDPYQIGSEERGIFLNLGQVEHLFIERYHHLPTALRKCNNSSCQKHTLTHIKARCRSVQPRQEATDGLCEHCGWIFFNHVQLPVCQHTGRGCLLNLGFQSVVTLYLKNWDVYKQLGASVKERVRTITIQGWSKTEREREREQSGKGTEQHRRTVIKHQLKY